MNVLKELIERYSEFAERNKHNGDLNMSDFLGYLNSFYSDEELVLRKISGVSNDNEFEGFRSINSEISILLVFMYRYARCYIRKALEESLLQTGDEFSFLITLMTHKSMAKSELISDQIMEKSTGIEILRRLVAKGLIREFPDRDDKRKVRVAITERGMKEIRIILPEMSRAADIISGNLTLSEKNTLLYLLKKLDYFHNDIFINHRDTSLDQIIKKTYTKNLIR